MVKQSLQVRLSQHLALTPQLQQSIRLLQLSTLELHQEIEQMLASNPLLEAEEEEIAAREALPEVSVDKLRQDEANRGESGLETTHDSASEEATPLDADSFGGTEREDWENGTERDDFDGIRELPSMTSGSEHGSDDDGTHDGTGAGQSLHEHLHEQMLGMRLSAVDHAALSWLIDSVDEDGYLQDSLEDLLAALITPQTTSDEQEELLARLQCALKWLQSMHPPGVGARGLADCLVLQLRMQERSQVQALAILICKYHLEALAKRDGKKIMAATGADETLLRAAQALISVLEPKPGRPFAPSSNAYVVPDVIVTSSQSGRGLPRVALNPDVCPKLRVNEMYANALRQQRGANTPLGNHLQEARWFIKNVQQRFDTILRVSQAIVERQKAFFTHGEIAMKPLVLREIADELGLHESTISRVTTAKYMATRFGTFELKYFFGSGLNTEAGGNASSTAVRALIKQFVAAEASKNPLSDSQLSTMLADMGIQVARRTVAKYREALRIAPANLRKEI